MREIHVDTLTNSVKALFMEANFQMGEDVESKIHQSILTEESPSGRAVLEQIAQNYMIARENSVPICQDTGMAVLFIEVGQEVHFVGGQFEDAIQKGVKHAYEEGYLRKSIVQDPLYLRKNTQDNTPAVVHLSLVEGDKVHILATAKGFGSENMSAIKMLTASDGEQGVVDFVLQTVQNAGPNPCPPIIVGVGIGGNFETCAIMAKRATTRDISTQNAHEMYKNLEDKLLHKINCLGIGPAGIGGSTTCLKVNVEFAPTHIAGMPCAVNICCHCARHKEVTI